MVSLHIESLTAPTHWAHRIDWFTGAFVIKPLGTWGRLWVNHLSQVRLNLSADKPQIGTFLPMYSEVASETLIRQCGCAGWYGPSLFAYALTHFLQVDSSTTALWTGLYPVAGCLVSLYYCFIEITVFNANSVDPAQMPHSMPHCMVSDLGLHSLPITFFRVSRIRWVKHYVSYDSR